MVLGRDTADYLNGFDKTHLHEFSGDRARVLWAWTLVRTAAEELFLQFFNLQRKNLVLTF